MCATGRLFAALQTADMPPELYARMTVVDFAVSPEATEENFLDDVTTTERPALMVWSRVRPT